MNNKELQLAKDFVELSIHLSPDKQFSPSVLEIDIKQQTTLYKAISELKKEGKIKISSSSEGGMIIKQQKN